MDIEEKGWGVGAKWAVGMLAAGAMCFGSYRAGLREGRFQEARETSEHMMASRALEDSARQQAAAEAAAQFEQEWEEAGEPVPAAR